MVECLSLCKRTPERLNNYRTYGTTGMLVRGFKPGNLILLLLPAHSLENGKDHILGLKKIIILA